LVGADAGGQVGHGRLMSKLAAERLSCSIELAPLAPNAARPGVAAQRIDHRTANATFSKRLELDAAARVEAVRGVDQAKHAVLHEIADVDGVRHRCRHPAGECFDKRQARDNAAILAGSDRLNTHPGLLFDSGVPSRGCTTSQSEYQLLRLCSFSL